MAQNESYCTFYGIMLVNEKGKSLLYKMYSSKSI